MNKIGILTSGGDAPGMNAALRSAVRVSLDLGIGIFGISEGYQGMVEGGKMIREPLQGIQNQGRTIKGSYKPCKSWNRRVNCDWGGRQFNRRFNFSERMV